MIFITLRWSLVVKETDGSGFGNRKKGAMPILNKIR